LIENLFKQETKFIEATIFALKSMIDISPYDLI